MQKKPVIGITMGDPVGVGPEVVVKALAAGALAAVCRPIVLGDADLLRRLAGEYAGSPPVVTIDRPDRTDPRPDAIEVVNLSRLDSDDLTWGRPSPETGQAMLTYIETAISWAMDGIIDGIVTGPINKAAMKMAGSPFTGHTELLADRTGSRRVAMLMAAQRLRVILVTIHIPLAEVPARLSRANVVATIQIAHEGLRDRYGIPTPRIAVAGLNPHAGEGGLFGDEEAAIIAPAVAESRQAGLDVAGPLSPDTVFYHAAAGQYDVVVCMYHDQGLIPFKLLHFNDGVNTTLGMPIIRTSVDHGTAYDIAGKGLADAGSLSAAVHMAVEQVNWRSAGRKTAPPAMQTSERSVDEC